MTVSIPLLDPVRPDGNQEGRQAVGLEPYSLVCFDTGFELSCMLQLYGELGAEEEGLVARPRARTR